MGLWFDVEDLELLVRAADVVGCGVLGSGVDVRDGLCLVELVLVLVCELCECCDIHARIVVRGWWVLCQCWHGFSVRCAHRCGWCWCI